MRSIGSSGVRADWAIVGLLWVAFFLNQADRQVFNVVLPLIQADLAISNEAVGLVATIFTLVYGLLVPFAGIAGDAFNRRWVVFASLLVFSFGTLTTAFASSLVILIVCRGVATGAGEAFYAPAASALIAETHDRTRARALALHQTANYTGIVLGSLLTGWIAERFGWRASFLVYGLGGIIWAAIIALVAWRVPAQSRPADPGVERRRLFEAMKFVSNSPRLIAQLLAFGALVFGLVGYLTWSPTLLHERFGQSIASAGFNSVFVHHLLAYVSLLATGVVTDRLSIRVPHLRLLTMAAGLLLCGPALLIAAYSSALWTMYAGFALYGLFRGMYDAGLFAAVFDEVPDHLRSSVIGLLIAAGFLIGAVSPLLMGFLKSLYGLQAGLILLAVVQIGGGGVLLVVTIFNPPLRAAKI